MVLSLNDPELKPLNSMTLRVREVEGDNGAVSVAATTLLQMTGVLPPLTSTQMAGEDLPVASEGELYPRVPQSRSSGALPPTTDTAELGSTVEKSSSSECSECSE